MKKIKVLLVEDDLITRSLVENCLVNNFCEVLLAGNGEEAVKNYLDHEVKIDVVIVDVMMPKLNGLELLVHIRQQQAYLETKVIGITSGYKNYLESLCSEKFDILLNKPLDLNHLVNLVVAGNQ